MKYRQLSDIIYAKGIAKIKENGKALAICEGLNI